MGIGALQGLSGALKNLSDTIRILAQQPPVPPTPSALASVEATSQFLKWIKVSKENGDVWLSDNEAYQALQLLGDEKTATLYLAVSEAVSEAFKRKWVMDRLGLHRDNSI